MANKGLEDELAELLHSGFRYAMSLTQDTVKAEDILQDAWLAVLRAQGPKKKAYLFSAIRSCFINQYRRELIVPIVSIDDETFDRARLEESSGKNDGDALGELGNETAKTSNFGASAAFTDTDIEHSLATLRPTEREALFLSAVEGYTAEEIATKTEQPRGTVLSLIHRAKLKIRNSFEQDIRRAKS